ncbi:MAG TPA: metallophosphoesterase [Leptolinea sp.]
MKILSVSDIELNLIYSPQIVDQFKQVDIIVSCGDLPYYYLEYMISMLNKPLYYVRGNHNPVIENNSEWERHFPLGGWNIHRKVTQTSGGMLLAGIEGCLRYNTGPQQYTQREMWVHVFHLIPKLFINRLRYGRFLDLFITHAPPWKIHDADDLPHQGIKAFRWFDEVFKPAYHLHGHVHLYRQDAIKLTFLGNTKILNTYGYQVTDIPALLYEPGLNR